MAQQLEFTLTKHKTPQLARLLQSAKKGKLDAVKDM
jgi:hypothetical protein